MKRCLIWGTGIVFKNNIRLIQYYEKIKKIKVIGVTSNESYYDSILCYSFIEKCNIDIKSFDILIIMAKGKTLLKIRKEAIEIGIDEEKIIPVYVMALPGFEFDKYSCIKKNVPTIFAPNCWGGITYNSLGLPFKSPFINMFENHADYIKFLKNPKYYISCPLEFKEMQYDSIIKRVYPVVKCGDIFLYFNHYLSFHEAMDCWNRRKERIDWNNIIVMFYDEDKNRVNEFYRLPYENKICFVPYPSDNEGVIAIDYKKKCPNKPFWQIVNGTASGSNLYYDVFELLLCNKVTPIVEIK